MKRWNGLCIKELKLITEWVYMTLAVILFVLVVGVLGVTGVIPGSIFFGLVIVIWLFVSLFLPVLSLLTSLSSEWKRTDIWLHSTSSIFQLFGVKAFFAAMLGLINLVVPAVIFMGYINLFDVTVGTVSSGDLTLGMGILLYAFYVTALQIMCLGLLVGVCYRLTKQSLRVFTIPIFIVLFVVGSRVYKVLTESVIYEKITHAFVVGDVSKSPILIEKGNFFAGPIEPYIYGGDVLMNVLIIVVLFMLSALLFEKKVRF